MMVLLLSYRHIRIHTSQLLMVEIRRLFALVMTGFSEAALASMVTVRLSEFHEKCHRYINNIIL